MSETYYVVAATADLLDPPQMHVDLNGEEILLCREGENYFAIAYYCSHEALTLEGGAISNGCITCPYHGAEFNLKTGEVMAPPAWEAIRTYPVKIENDTIAIAVAAPE